MTPGERRRFKRQFDEQVRLERNGAPPPPEIAAQMTKPSVRQPLHQVVVDVAQDDGTRTMQIIGPALIQPVAEEFARTINRLVSSGQERTWSNAHVIACQGVN